MHAQYFRDVCANMRCVCVCAREREERERARARVLALSLESERARVLLLSLCGSIVLNDKEDEVVPTRMVH